MATALAADARGTWRGVQCAARFGTPSMTLSRFTSEQDDLGQGKNALRYRSRMIPRSTQQILAPILSNFRIQRKVQLLKGESRRAAPPPPAAALHLVAHTEFRLPGTACLTRPQQQQAAAVEIKLCFRLTVCCVKAVGLCHTLPPPSLCPP